MTEQAWIRPPRPNNWSMDQLRSLVWYRILVAIGTPLFVLAGAAALYFFDPERGSAILPCFFHLVTGLDCIGCGLTRAMHAFLHGDIITGLSYNLIMPFWLLLPAYALFAEWLRALAGRPLLPAIRDRRWLLILLLVSSLTFMILRNLPWAPFTWLAA